MVMSVVSKILCSSGIYCWTLSCS